MDYFQGVVGEYLRANRSTFINTECMIQLDPGNALKGRHWYCDIVAVNLADKEVYLCEVSFSKTLHALMGRLQAWNANWPALKTGLIRDCGIDEAWEVVPCVFIPKELHPVLTARLPLLNGGGMPAPRVMHLEKVVPWKYQHWDRKLAAIQAMHDEAIEDTVSPEGAGSDK